MSYCVAENKAGQMSYCVAENKAGPNELLCG